MPIGFNPSDIPEGWPRGIYHLRLESCMAGETDDGRFKLSLTAKIMEPEQFAEKPMYHTFYLGTQEDPLCEAPGWAARSYPAKSLKRLVKAAELPDEVLADFEEGLDVYQAEVLVDIGPNLNKKTGTVYSNNVFGWYAVGTKEVGLAEEETGETDNESSAVPPAPRTTRKRKAKEPEDSVPEVKTLDCPGCEKSFEKKEYASHVAECEDVLSA